MQTKAALSQRFAPFFQYTKNRVANEFRFPASPPSCPENLTLNWYLEQKSPIAADGERPHERPEHSSRTALVLSGGGMFGAYQAGVWSVLEGIIQPDIVVGASIGALNGWLIAGGASSGSLLDRWRNLEAVSQPRFRFPRQLGDGILDASQVENRIYELHSQCSPVVRYGVVATKLKTLKPVLFEWPDVTWSHLAASCGIPVFLRQHRIGGVLYADGGLVDPLPLWAAVQMGATKIVTVNLLKSRPLFVRAAAIAARVYSGYRDNPYPQVDTVNISPAASLGTARDSMCWSRENNGRWIAQGRADAYALKHLVVECLMRV